MSFTILQPGALATELRRDSLTNTLMQILICVEKFQRNFSRFEFPVQSLYLDKGYNKQKQIIFKTIDLTYSSNPNNPLG